MKRRDFLAGGPAPRRGRPPARAPGEAGATAGGGRFLLTGRARVLSVAHGREPERVLWETDPAGNFLVGRRATCREPGVRDARGVVRHRRRGRRPLGAPDDRGDRGARRRVAVTAGCAGRGGQDRLSAGGSRRWRRSAPLHWPRIDARGVSRCAPARQPGGTPRGVLRLRPAADLLRPEGQPAADPGAGARDRARAAPGDAAWSISSSAAAAAARMSPSARRRSSSPPGCARCSWRTSSSDLRLAPERPVRRQGLVGGDDRAHPLWATPLELIEAYTAYAGRMRPLPDWVHQG